MTRTDLVFGSGDADCAAWLYRPEADEDRPVVVMAHGLGGVRQQRLDAFAERFVAAGYACLVFDYRHFGASGGDPRQLLDIPRQLADWRAAVAVARTLPGVEPERVVVWGTSFGGGHSIVTAAEVPGVVAAIAQCPFTDGLASALAIPRLTSVRLTALALLDVVGALLGREPVLVPTAGPPGSTALMSAPDCEPGLRALGPEGTHPRKEVAARIALQLALHVPGRRAADVPCPLLVVVTEQDTVAPAGPTKKYAARAPHGEVVSLDTGHFDIYVGEWFERNVAEQLEFLARHVPVG